MRGMPHEIVSLPLVEVLRQMMSDELVVLDLTVYSWDACLCDINEKASLCILHT